jgi:hypothetical protein
MIKRNSFVTKYKTTSAAEVRLAEGQFLLEGRTLDIAKSPM